MSKSDTIVMCGTITECLPNALFRVTLDSGHLVIGHIAGRLRKNRIQIIIGDKIEGELSPYDLGKIRITYRHR